MCEKSVYRRICTLVILGEIIGQVMIMIKEDSFIGKEVVHSKYGVGTIKSIEKNHMMICFGEETGKKFRYPDAFEGFLTTLDTGLQKRIEDDLQIRHGEADYAEHKKTEALYKNKKEFEQKKAAEQEERKQKIIEKQRRAQMMSKQRMSIYDLKIKAKLEKNI